MIETLYLIILAGIIAIIYGYIVGAQILSDLGVKKIRLLTNNPQKIVGLSGFDLEVVERIPIPGEITDENIDYLRAKKQKLGHLIDTNDDPQAPD